MLIEVWDVTGNRRTPVDIALADEHCGAIVLPTTYSRDAPLFRMPTLVFHPNIAQQAAYDTKSRLSGRAGQRVQENLGRLPIAPAPFLLEAAFGESRA